jgi:ATP-dependent protease ClpP protease subunit
VFFVLLAETMEFNSVSVNTIIVSGVASQLAAIQASTPLKQRVSSSNFSIFCIFLRR